MPILLLLVSLLFPSFAAAEILLCPYEVQSNELGAKYRVLALDRWTSSLAPLLGAKPWSEIEVAGDQAQVTINWSGLTGLLQTTLTTALPGGPGCTGPLTEKQRSDTFMPTRAAKRDRDGNPTKDDTDKSRPVINPIQFKDVLDKADADMRREILDAVAQVPIRQPPTFFSWLFSVAKAWAQAASFPAFSILDAFTYADQNLTAASTNWTAGPHTSTTPRIVSNAVRRATGANADAYYNRQTYVFRNRGEVFVAISLPATNGAQRVYWYTAATIGGSQSGYNCRMTVVSGGANDTAALFRADAGTDTQLGSTVTAEWAAADIMGIRNTFGSLAMYHTASAIITQTDTTYGGNGYYGLLVTANDSEAIDDFGAGAMSLGSRPAYFLGGH